MKNRSIDFESIRSTMASWYGYVIPTHLHSMALRSASHRRYLATEAALAESFVADAFGPAQPAHSGRTTLEVDEQFMSRIMSYWLEEHGVGNGLVEDIFRALCLQFLRGIDFEDYETFAVLAARSTGIIFVANHQTAVESSLFTIVFSALSRRPVVSLSKAEHKTSWIGAFIRFVSEYPGTRIPDLILYMDRSDRESVLRIFRTLIHVVSQEGRCGLIHVEGTRARTAGLPVGTVSSALIDMACDANITLVPIRFTGGLPVTEAETRLDYPTGFGDENVRVGVPLDARELRRLPPVSRRQLVLERLNRLVPKNEVPNPPKPWFEREIRRLQAQMSAPEDKLAVVAALTLLSHRSDETSFLLGNLARDDESFEDTPEGRWLRRLARFIRPGGDSASFQSSVQEK